VSLCWLGTGWLAWRVMREADKPKRRVYARLGGLSIWVTLLAMYLLR
jgi:hypothetical protein